VLVRKLSRLIRNGRLTVKGLRQEPIVFGSPVLSSGQPDVVVRIRGPVTAWKIALRPDPYFGEAYMDGALLFEHGTLWDLLELCGRNLAGRPWLPIPPLVERLAHALTRGIHQMNSRRSARRNVEHHYDLPDALFRSFLDANRHYSCAYFRAAGDTLEEAQAAKVAHIAAKLLLRPGMHVLDIGCGWGGLAIGLARLTGACVTGITLSKEQANYAIRRVEKAGLKGQVTIAVMDYREVRHQYDRIVSVGMFEHVGVPYYSAFFEAITRLLLEDGVALLHSIGRMNGPGMTGAWTRKYIFPGGYVPALSEVLPRVERAGLLITDIELLRLHYAETLRQWRERFLRNAGPVRVSHGDRFCRMWEFFLATSEAGFRYADLMVFQMQLAKRVDAVPLTRDYVLASEAAMRAVGDLPVRFAREG